MNDSRDLEDPNEGNTKRYDDGWYRELVLPGWSLGGYISNVRHAGDPLEVQLIPIWVGFVGREDLGYSSAPRVRPYSGNSSMTLKESHRVVLFYTKHGFRLLSYPGKA